MLVTRQFHRSLVQRTNENIEQFLRDSHSIPPTAL
jgi:hypothetical protein